jgi:methyltransferase (TIGR00027 family)
METDRPDALFVDPYARRMAGKRGMDIVDSLPLGHSMAWSMSVRTAVMDGVILQCVERGARTVLNLGAGLDTRAYRLCLPRSLRWMDVDMPAMTAYRRDCLGDNVPSCEHIHVAADLSDATQRAQVFAKARCGDGPWLVITEGLLVYLTPEQVNELAEELRSETPARWWVADLISPMLQQAMGMVWHLHLADAGAPFRFAPHDSKSFFEELGWREAEFHSTWAESIRLGRTARHGEAWDQLWRWSGHAAHETVKRMSGIALLERAR